MAKNLRLNAPFISFGQKKLKIAAKSTRWPIFINNWRARFSLNLANTEHTLKEHTTNFGNIHDKGRFAMKRPLFLHHDKQHSCRQKTSHDWRI